MATVPITNLAAAATGAQPSFNTAHLLPHGYESADAARDVASAANLRELQKLMGEDPSKMNKVNTKTVATAIIRNAGQIVTACANTSVLTNTLVDHDLVSLTPDKVPFIHLASRKLAITLTSRECVEYVTRYRCNAKLHYYAFGVLNRTHCLFFKVLKDEPAILLAKPRNASVGLVALNQTSFKMAATCLDKGIESLFEVFNNAKELEHTLMYTSSAFSEESQKAYALATNKRKATDAFEKDAAKANRQIKREGEKAKDIVQPRAKNIGALICKTRMPLYLPPATEWPEGEKVLCPAAVRNGGRGCTRENCFKSHAKVETWSKKLLAFMKKFVASKKELSWNHDVATPAILGLELNTNGEKV